MNNKTITISIPHRLGQEEARKRLQAGVAEMRNKYSSHIANVAETWNQNRMEFRMSVMSQTITGRAEVLADAVKLEIDLPWLVATLAEQLRPRIEEEGRRILEQK